MSVVRRTEEDLSDGVRNGWFPRALIGLFLGVSILLATAAGAERVTVFAASSLKDVLEEVAPGFAEATGHTAVFSLAGSSVLARQIAQGAPADVFISANPKWMDWLESEKLTAPDTRHDLLGNQIVLIAHGEGRETEEISSDLDLGDLLGDGRLAMALVEAVPAGIYGKAALESLGLWDEVGDRVVQVDNVRAALALVVLGEASLGIVYATDAAAATGVSVLGSFPTDSHPTVVYPVAGISGRETDAGTAFLSYLTSPAARAVFEAWGFSVLGD